MLQSPQIKHHQPNILYLAKLSLRNAGKINMFPDKKKQFITRPALQEMLRGIQAEMKRHSSLICKHMKP